MQTRVVTMTEQGSPSVMSVNTVDIELPSEGEVQIKQNVIGFNYMDIYQRSGLYPLDLPSSIGLEAAGTIKAIGANVDEFNVGDRVAYATAPQGAYAEYRNFPANRVVHLPKEVSDEQCAATLFKGMTVEYLLNRCYDIKKNEKVLFLGSGGGVGTLAGQWGSSKGAYMVGIDGGEEKCELARRSGYSEVIDFTKENVVERVKEITEGAGMPVVYDPIGGPTYEQTLDCLGPRGYFISFGWSSSGMGRKRGFEKQEIFMFLCFKAIAKEVGNWISFSIITFLTFLYSSNLFKFLSTFNAKIKILIPNFKSNFKDAFKSKENKRMILPLKGNGVFLLNQKIKSILYLL